MRKFNTNGHIFQIFNEGYEPTEQEFELCDINTDGQVNVIDIVNLVNIVLDN